MTRLNFTGRKRVTRDRVRLRVIESDAELMLNVERLEFGGLALPDDARVIVEAYRQTARHRVCCGTVGELRLPTSVPLREFDVREGLLFRVKVVGVGDTDGKLLAAGDRIPAISDNEDGARTPILPFRPSADLGHRLWQLDTEEEPTVLVNAEVGDWKSFVLQPYFQALVYPELVRQLALWVLRNKDDAEDGESAASAWCRFLADLGYDCHANPPDDDEQEQWANDVAASFARKHKFLDRMKLLIDGEAVA